jgi:predicted acylesterase/phospholipase RssA
VRILSVDGGGYLGLTSAAFLAELERHFQSHCRDRFDLFCGTSTGAILVLALAAGKTADEVTSAYEELGRRVFPPRRGPLRWYRKWISGAFRAQYSSTPLAAGLEKIFGDMTLGDLRSRGKLAMITAFCVSNGQPRVFKTDHSAGLSAHDGYLLRDVALASAAAPTYLPLVALRAPHSGLLESFCDGGVFANTPALLAYAEAIHELHVAPSSVELLSIATPRADLAEYAAFKGALRLDRGWWDWKASISSVMIDAVSMISSSALQRIVKAHGGGSARYERIELRRADGLGIDVTTPAATHTLRQIGCIEAMNNDVRARMQPFFNDESPSRKGVGDGEGAEVL